MLQKSRGGSKADKNQTRSTTKREASANIINYKGALLDIDSLMQRLDKSEHSRTALEKKLEEMTAEICKLILTKTWFSKMLQPKCYRQRIFSF